LKINPNFSIESCEANKIFLSDREACKGYYIHLNNNTVESLTENRIESLAALGLYDNEAIYKKPHFINRIIKFSNPISEKTLFTISILLMLFGILGATLSIWNSWPMMEINGIANFNVDGFVFIKSMLIFLMGIISVHEMAHVLSARLQNIEVFTISFKLKYYFIPIFYVKIVPTGNNLKRANIAFAGNVADSFLIIIYSSMFIVTGDLIWSIVLTLQIIMGVFNYNILFPTDFYIGFFSLIKKPDFRVQSINFTNHFFTRRSAFHKKIHLYYLIYGILFYGMFILFLVTTGLNITYWIIRGVNG